MPWCPKCRLEYVEGIQRCADCEVSLLAELPPEEKEDYDHEAFLMQVSSPVEADFIKAMLESYKIPVLLKGKDAWMTHITGVSTAYVPIDMYVPSRALDAAKQILESHTMEGDTQTETEDSEEAEEVDADPDDEDVEEEQDEAEKH